MAFMPDNKITSLSGLIDVGRNFFVGEFLPFFRNLSLGFEETSINSVINALFWCTLFFGVVFYYFTKILQFFLRTTKVRRYKWRQTIQTAWNICFFLASAIFLDLYHDYFIAPQILRETGRFFPKYENALFLVSDDIRKFNTISLILVAFYLVSALLDLKGRDVSESATKLLYGCVLISFYYLGFENFSVMLNVNMGIFNFFTECITLLALHTSDKNDALFKFYVALRFISWSYVYLTLLPFKYLVPTLYAKNFKLWLNIFVWLWYGSSVWNSPLLQYFYHQIFHINPTDCIGGESITRCILLKDSQELRHFNNLQKAVLELKLAKERQNPDNKTSESTDSGNASSKAFQSIKCMMVLKRKLKRIRQAKDFQQRKAINDGAHASGIQTISPDSDDDDDDESSTASTSSNADTL